MAQLSGWIDTEADWQKWAVDSNALDIEIFGMGDNNDTATYATWAKWLSRKSRSREGSAPGHPAEPGGGCDLPGKHL